ncbi:YqgE/AlgH family protein [Polycladidibacter stylochi]|uniref:YqgE/AlgH family protein n=1 Tax=Polycladidibacter stylochi TaxID=1807766 RepID=UPI0008299752|nr:YqgE/AlgH family protein [Pseudovibrio stylochi]
MQEGDNNQYMEGQYLIAMPSMDDGRFAHSVVYVCAHSEEGAMGIILNQPVDNINFSELLKQLNILPEGDEYELPPDLRNMKVYQGGPVDTGRGFVLHSDDFFLEGFSLPIENGICLTATLEILRALAEGRGPSRALLALGYAGWAPGQLESEIQANGWLTCAADPSLVFEVQDHDKWGRALQIMGIEPGMLSSDAGHA